MTIPDAPGTTEAELADARAFYLAMYERDGGRWDGVDPRHHDVWIKAARRFRQLAAPPAPDRDAEVRRLREALEATAKFVDDYFAPWGAWKTAWWEFEVSDSAVFSPENALQAIANKVRAALNPREGEAS